MKNYLILVVLSSILVIAGCDTKGVPTELSKACDVENDGKVLEINGFLDDKGGVFCSNTGGGPVRCGFKLKENPASDKTVSADIEAGDWANSVEKPTSGYKREDLKIRDNNGSLVNLADKVKVTGKIRTTKDPVNNTVVCYMTVSKIEK